MRAIILGCFLLFIGTSIGMRVCHQCSGINCQRNSLNKTETCVNDMDVCVTVFDGSAVQAQGCLQSLAENLRRKCMDNNGRMDMPAPAPMQQCHMCLSNLCNDMGPKEYACIQCDSEKDEQCRNDPAMFMPTQCPISRANNAYCYLKDDGKRIVRGCAGMLEEQRDCLSRKDCFLCSPMDFKACNVVPLEADESGGNGGDGGENNGGNGGNNGGDGGNNGGDGGNNGGDGGNNGGDGGNNGGNDGGNNNGQSSIIDFNFKMLVVCFFAVVFCTP